MLKLSAFLLEKPWRAAVFAAAILALSVIAPLKSYIMQWLIDADSKAEALRAMALGAAVIVASHGVEYIARDCFAKMSTSAVNRARHEVMGSIAARSMKQHMASASGDVQSCLTNDMRIIFDDYYMGLFNLCMWGGMGVVALAMLASISPVLMVIAAVLCLLPLVVPRLMSGPLGRVRGDYSKDTAAYTGRVGELMKGFEALLTSGGMDYMTRSHDRAAQSNHDRDYAMRRVMNAASIFTSFGAWLPSVLVMLVGVFLVFDGRMTIGYLVTANSLTNFVIAPFRSVSSAYVNIRSAAPILKRVEEMMNEQPAPDGTRGISHAGDIALQGVTYTYPGATSPALRSVSLTVRRGEKVALTGPSGSGKSTIAKLLYRYDDAQAGQITADGVPLESIRRDAWYACASMIPQTPFLFSDTIRQNICLYHDYAPGQIEEAVRRAGLEEYIASLPDGLDTMITEGGRNLSGGQMQRIAIARALLRGTDLILVDEATSSLDIATTCAVMDNLMSLDCTVIVITHDLYGEAIQRLDRIVYLEQGEVKEQGTLHELLERNGGFASLYRQMETKEE